MPRSRAMHLAMDDAPAKRDSYLFENLPYVTCITDNIVLTRDTELLGCVLLHGISADTTSEEDLDALSATFANLINSTQGRVTYYVSKITSRRSFDYAPMSGDGFADLVDRRWKDSFKGAQPFERKYLITIGIRPNRQDGFKAIFSKKRSAFFEQKSRLISMLDKLLDDVERSFSNIGAKRLTASSGWLLGYLRAISTGEIRKIAKGVQLGMPIAAQINSEDILFQGKSWDRDVNGVIENNEGRFGAILSLKKYPAETISGMYDAFDLPISSVVTNSFVPLPSNVAQQKTDIIAKQMRSSGDSAISLEVELTDALDDLASGRITLGNHHCTVAVHADSKEELEDAISYIERVGAMGGGLFHHEGFAARAAYFAQHPGNQAMRPRVSTITSQNFADMAAFHNRPMGRTNNLPWNQPITFLRSAQNDIYAFNFHIGQQTADENTSGHSLLLGPTGTGKTTAAAFLATQAQRLGVRIFAFDKDRGLEVPLRAMGVAYSAVAVGKPTGLNPFASETDDRGVAWMANWLERLVSHHAPLSASQRNALADAAKENALAAADDPDLNTFENFVSFFRSLEDDGDLSERFEEWTKGRFAWMFDGQGQDPLANSNGSAAFDVSELFDEPIMRSAWLGYVMRRIERIVENGHPTLIIMDEAWKLLDDEKFVERIKEWLLVMRKKNTVVLMLAQTPEQLLSSAASDAIQQGVSTKIAFQSPRTRPEGFEKLGYTPSEASVLKTDGASRSALCLSDLDSIVLDMDLGALGKAVNILGPNEAIKSALPEDWRENPNFWKEFV